ncbi:MAG TPA: sigma-70 family RNA polymerase sigma factor [Pseudonocardiaceae bacterium]|nr:sigma-70 family RNA polymerase sigma factor [Pseudonocardiaceae bacterium]
MPHPLEASMTIAPPFRSAPSRIGTAADAADVADAGAGEGELVAALRRRDEATYRMLVRRYTPLMLRLARPHVPSQAIAEDVVQDTWVAVLQGIDTFQSRSRFSTWLMRILLNTARKRGVREHSPVRWDALVAGSPFAEHLSAEHRSAEPVSALQASPEATALAAELRAALGKAIRVLPDRQRTVLVLRDVEGRTAEEVCALLGLSANNQRVLLHRARAAVRARLLPRLDDLGLTGLVSV